MGTTDAKENPQIDDKSGASGGGVSDKDTNRGDTSTTSAIARHPGHGLTEKHEIGQTVPDEELDDGGWLCL